MQEYLIISSFNFLLFSIISLNKTKLLVTNTSNFVGVNPDTRNRKTKWVAEIIKDKIKIYLGAYVELCDAVYARHVAERILFGEFSSNFNEQNIKEIIALCTEQEKIKDYVLSRIVKKLWV
jgi:hypothetical protein